MFATSVEMPMHIPAAGTMAAAAAPTAITPVSQRGQRAVGEREQHAVAAGVLRQGDEDPTNPMITAG